MPTNRGAFKLFSLAGIGVYVHWSWFLTFYILPRLWERHYSNYAWFALEILGLFLIVLTHEFGHQLACRSVGGKTHDIVLWPLGGVAYVSPPERPGAQLWSIAAGPLVNVILVPILTGLWLLGRQIGWGEAAPDIFQLLTNIWFINVGLLIFNMMPIYPLDGGQILRSLLWFLFGRANSLSATSIIGFIGAAGLVVLTVYSFLSAETDKERNGAIWIGVMAAFILMNCWGGLRHAQALARIARIPRRPGFACPSCHTAPPLGEVWRCGKCGQAFDTFATQAQCPHCGTQFGVTQCLDCGTASPIGAWQGPIN